MYKYTICFIKQGTKLLMLNRVKAPTMGLWNGVGGKLELGETPLECVVRESFEETGIVIEEPSYKGIVTWEIDESYIGGMYAYIAELSEEYIYPTPRVIPEGILDWKEIDWVLTESNHGVGELIPRYLPLMLSSEAIYEHKCKLVNRKLVEYEARETLLSSEILTRAN
ncbi:MAG: MutT/nudix family protein [Paenibacillus sp.]|nr:MutT/nudix family protein [Paenibacillus sp.]